MRVRGGADRERGSDARGGDADADGAGDAGRDDADVTQRPRRYRGAGESRGGGAPRTLPSLGRFGCNPWGGGG